MFGIMKREKREDGCEYYKGVLYLPGCKPSAIKVFAKRVWCVLRELPQFLVMLTLYIVSIGGLVAAIIFGIYTLIPNTDSTFANIVLFILAMCVVWLLYTVAHPVYLATKSLIDIAKGIIDDIKKIKS